MLSFWTCLLLKFFKKQARFNCKQGVFKEADEDLLKDISWAIWVVNKYVPWESVCRHQAYQAKVLCQYYGIPYQIFVGFRKNEESGKIEAHAWTIAKGIIITGFCNPEEYTVQTIYPIDF